jgi:hypothetical protein
MAPSVLSVRHNHSTTTSYVTRRDLYLEMLHPKNCPSLQVMAGQPVCHLVATDWYKSTKKMDALASRPGNKVMQVWLHMLFS